MCQQSAFMLTTIHLKSIHCVVIQIAVRNAMIFNLKRNFILYQLFSTQRNGEWKPEMIFTFTLVAFIWSFFAIVFLYVAKCWSWQSLLGFSIGTIMPKLRQLIGNYWFSTIFCKYGKSGNQDVSLKFIWFFYEMVFPCGSRCKNFHKTFKFLRKEIPDFGWKLVIEESEEVKLEEFFEFQFLYQIHVSKKYKCTDFLEIFHNLSFNTYGYVCPI